MKQMAYLKSWASSFLSAFLSGLKDPFKSSFIHCSQRHPPRSPAKYTCISQGRCKRCGMLWGHVINTWRFFSSARKKTQYGSREGFDQFSRSHTVSIIFSGSSQPRRRRPPGSLGLFMSLFKVRTHQNSSKSFYQSHSLCFTAAGEGSD